MERLPEKKEAKWTLEELIQKASLVLELPRGSEIRQSFVKIAAEQLPSPAYESALEMANQYFVIRTAINYAKACRFLAVIKRVYGPGKFNEVTA